MRDEIFKCLNVSFLFVLNLLLKERNEFRRSSGDRKCEIIGGADCGAVATTSSTAESGGGGSGSKGEDKGQSNRKARWCWAPELHRRFLQALQQLGDPHVATPKQIQELMKVDGLTNDEVKSHLHGEYR
ncbi:putative transcription factor MYB-HB-like family [Helianthus debilis subsp. tardiflorus]